MNDNSCSILFKQIHDELEKTVNNSLRQDDLTLSQASTLQMLENTEDRSMELKTIEHSQHVAQSTAAGIVKRLEVKGLVESFGTPDDRRIKMIRITPPGREYCRRARSNMEDTESMLLSSLTDAERSILHTLLTKVRSSFQ